MRIAAVTGGRVVAGSGLIAGDLGIADERIVTIGAGAHPGPSLDARGLVVLPGFIDIHTHGGGGHSFFTSEPERLASYSDWAPAHGVTAYLASFVGDDADATRTMLHSLRRASSPGAACLGFHLEGPFINPGRRGAFPEETLRVPNREEFASYQAAAEGRIRQVTFAPELEGGMELLEEIVRRGAVAAVGHTDATFAEASAAFEAGATHVTHLFNAMRPLHHREGGVLAAALASKATCELIFDTVHVDENVLRLAYRVLGERRTVVVTDNLYLAGAARSEGRFAGGTVSAVGNVAMRGDATIVGSLLPMDGHFRNVIKVLGANLEVAARLCATNAAAVIGEAERGSIEPGKFADLVLLDERFEVVATVCAGRVAYLRPGDERRHSA